MRTNNVIDKKKILRETSHLTRPPRLEGAVKNAGMYSDRKQKKHHIIYSSHEEPINNTEEDILEGEEEL